MLTESRVSTHDLQGERRIALVRDTAANEKLAPVVGDRIAD